MLSILTLYLFILFLFNTLTPQPVNFSLHALIFFLDDFNVGLHGDAAAQGVDNLDVKTFLNI
jgi:hypothetical protein